MEFWRNVFTGEVKSRGNPKEGLEINAKRVEHGLIEEIVWGYMSHTDFKVGPGAFFDWMYGLRRAIQSGAVDTDEVLQLIGLSEPPRQPFDVEAVKREMEYLRGQIEGMKNGDTAD